VAQARIRTARAEDVEEVLALWERTRSATIAVADTRDALLAVIAAPAGEVLLAEADGQIVGTLIATFDGWRGNMYRLATAPEYRRRGIATALVTEAHRLLALAGARRISALVVGGERDAVRFWDAAGYTHDTQIDRYARTLEASAPADGDRDTPLPPTA
jgi:ribosomal protein S18 acetylase RimI-like enzyme